MVQINGAKLGDMHPDPSEPCVIVTSMFGMLCLSYAEYLASGIQIGSNLRIVVTVVTEGESEQ